MEKSPKAPVQNAGAPQDAGKSNEEQEIRKKSEKKKECKCTCLGLVGDLKV
jgi:hypothetical protein